MKERGMILHDFFFKKPSVLYVFIHLTILTVREKPLWMEAAVECGRGLAGNKKDHDVHAWT